MTLHRQSSSQTHGAKRIYTHGMYNYAKHHDLEEGVYFPISRLPARGFGTYMSPAQGPNIELASAF